MYLKKKLITALRIKNVLLILFCAFEFMFSTTYMVSMFAEYSNDLETAWNSVAMKSSIIMTAVAVVLLIYAMASVRHVGNAVFYSSLFEGDLDGYMSFKDIAQVVGKSESAVRRQLHAYRTLYMKNFKFISTGSGEVVEMYSKKSLCECKSCGAHIEKRIYFTGECPYCHSSDLHAKVLVGEHFLSVSNELSSGKGRPDYYRSGTLILRRVLYFILLVLGLSLAVILFIYTASEIGHYFDEDYQRQILLDPSKHLQSYELIKNDIRQTIVYGSISFAVLAVLAVMRWKRTMALFSAADWSTYFSKAERPFIKVEKLPDLNFASSGKSKLKRMRLAIRNGYLKNCTLEVHGGVLVVALAKKTVKDRCLSCGAPLVGVKDENDKCRYCGNLVMGVLEKR